MIIKILKEFTVTELHNFTRDFPERYGELCKIIGEFQLGVRHLYLAITLPYYSDRGCIIASTIKDGVINVVDIRYF